jgi:hypothetical protein
LFINGECRRLKREGGMVVVDFFGQSIVTFHLYRELLANELAVHPFCGK